jgi:hypothetical protein
MTGDSASDRPAGLGHPHIAASLLEDGDTSSGWYRLDDLS